MGSAIELYISILTMETMQQERLHIYSDGGIRQDEGLNCYFDNQQYVRRNLQLDCYLQ
jgi:hypothetical protein